MASVLAVFWTWKVALGVLGAAAAVWFLLAAFVASRWPAVYPWLGQLRSARTRTTLVAVLVALAVGGAFLSRSAYARGRDAVEEFGRRRADRRLVFRDHPERRMVIRSFGQPGLTLVDLSPCSHRSVEVNVEGEATADVDVDVDEEQQEAIAEAQEAAREAAEEAREAAAEARRDAEEQTREAQEEARTRVEEARQNAEERAQAARERAQERMEEARERARERTEQAQERARERSERAQEIAERELERAQAVLERMGDEMDSTRDAVEEGLEDGDSGHSHSTLEAFLEGQADKVERLGRSVAQRLRGLASRFDGDEDHDEDADHDEVDL